MERTPRDVRRSSSPQAMSGAALLLRRCRAQLFSSGESQPVGRSSLRITSRFSTLSLNESNLNGHNHSLLILLLERLARGRRRPVK
ncbi:hypothetical protein KFK09_004831 [Dendrobium nobile]|uniref:Uncharacterized protein n=1 Tax=Dendrobium nobile TaxID=94219 RepID=A0A8T3BWH3_DENNO|nr:hypothetical protein KFK09_004831 [Dendrobium nobile]